MELEKQYELMAKTLSGDITAEEKALLDKWLGESKENALAFEQVKQAWALTAQQTVVADTDSVWNKLKGSIEAEEKTEVIKIVPMRWMGRIAAAVVALVGIGFLLNNYVSEPQLKTIASANEKLKVVLPDNSVVWLNKYSEISFKEKFRDTKREVELKGEAFFDVVHDEKQPFVVKAGESVIEDIGTSFGVRTSQAEDEEPITRTRSLKTLVEVTVVTGEVSFSGTHLLPGDKGSLFSDLITVEKVDNFNALAWQSNKLVFEKSTLKDVAATLYEYYQVPVEAKGTAADVLFTGTFDHASLEDAIRILETSTGTHISKQQNGYSISVRE